MPPLWQLRLKQIVLEFIIIVLLVIGAVFAVVVAALLLAWLCVDILRWPFNWAWGLLTRPCHQ